MENIPCLLHFTRFCNVSKTKFKSLLLPKELVTKPRCKKHSIRYVQLIQVLKPHIFVFLPKVALVAFISYSFGLVSFNFPLLEHVLMLVSKWCVEHLIIKTIRNGPMAHCPFISSQRARLLIFFNLPPRGP